MSQNLSEDEKALGYIDLPAAKNVDNEFSYLPGGPNHLPPAEFKMNLEVPKRRGVVTALVDMAKENPLVPIGLGTAIFAFVNGVRNMNNPSITYKMMRLRVYAQAFTFVALIGVPIYKGLDTLKEHRRMRMEQCRLEKEQEANAEASPQTTFDEK